jgi:N-acetylglucosaminyldiphosphoundecaprenol N-acetyl-beta-D-mannosaminyltransferase
VSVPRNNFLGLPLALVGRAGLMEELASAIARGGSGTPFTVFYLNAQGAVHARNDPAYRDAIRGAGLVYADGMGVVLGARMMGVPVPEKLTTTDLFPAICGRAAKEGWKISILGARPGVAAEAASRLTASNPGLRIVGTRDGYWEPGEEGALLAGISSEGPDILLVCLGLPRQEAWVAENALALAGIPVIMTGGGLLDFLSGRTPRGPKWMTDHGLEWLARLFVEPRRLWKRYLIGLPAFAYFVARERIRRVINLLPWKEPRGRA